MGEQIGENEMGEDVARTWETETPYFVGETRREKLPNAPRCRCECNIKPNLKDKVRTGSICVVGSNEHGCEDKK